uniref:Uncharacterized protein n=1 Tax=Utricularia reniformis TaxID=192314 RepID=A0A1Y0B1N1_9LAMI|nr:hypothetical protein AEK19_MT1140 [Utricularia reniformis]ART31356.1 hypothetical protein AEK19_MT1140 [Utricularia reniformis]
MNCFILSFTRYLEEGKVLSGDSENSQLPRFNYFLRLMPLPLLVVQFRLAISRQKKE